MFFFIATVLTNVIISVILKMFGRWDIDTLQAIVVNYFVCVITGCIATGQMPFHSETLFSDWVPWTMLMGVSFIAVFNLMAYCARVSGMTSMVLANKLSLVIPVVFSMLIFRERAGLLTIVGILTAFPAVYLATVPTESGAAGRKQLLWPAVLFIASGGLDSLVNFIQARFLTSHEAQASGTIICFATAAVSGSILLVQRLATGASRLAWRNIIAGICLGVPNFFSILFFVKALHSNVFQSSSAIPVINVSILVLSTVTAIIVFRENAGIKRITGLALAILAIILISMGR